MIGAASLEDKIAAIRDGGWDGIEKAFEDKIAQAGATTVRQLTAEDRTTIQSAWYHFMHEVPGGRMALEELVNRTLNRAVFLTHYGWNAEQVAIFGAAREGQNFIVNVILNQILMAMEKPAEQRDPT